MALEKVLGKVLMERRRFRVVGAMLEREPGRYLITQRSRTASLPLLWEFPGGKVEGDERDEVALCRELKERLGLDVRVVELAMATHHEYPGHDIDFHVFRCVLARPDQDVSHARVNDHRWVTLEEMGDHQFPDADARTLAKLLDLDE
jgi:8-oxo-dGTP diphosphatase